MIDVNVSIASRASIHSEDLRTFGTNGQQTWSLCSLRILFVKLTLQSIVFESHFFDAIRIPAFGYPYWIMELITIIGLQPSLMLSSTHSLN
jgi:hypothetical protein